MAKREDRHQDGDIRTLLAEQKASGLSVAAFARDRGVPKWRLYEGRQRLRKRKSRAKKVDFVQVHVRPVQPAPSPIKVELEAGMRVHVPLGFDEDELRRLLAVLSSC